MSPSDSEKQDTRPGRKGDAAETRPGFGEEKVEVALPDGPSRSMRHELRTPLNQIIGYAELLQEEAREEGLDRFSSDLKKIESAGRRMLELIERVGDPAAALVQSIASSRRARKAAAPQEPPPALPRESEEASQASLLVVDDNEMNRDMLARRLARRGFAVEKAEGGREALELIERSSFDLVLLDVMMPEVSGLDVLQRVRQSLSMSDLPVIMATARDASEDIVKALELGANDYVTKPLDMPVVLARVATQLQLKRARDRVKRLALQLEDAQERIAKLSDSSLEALQNVDAWSSSVSKEIAQAIGAESIDVWLLDGDEVAALTTPSVDGPTQGQIKMMARSGQHLERDGNTIVPVFGISGEIFGALVVNGPEVIWGLSGRRLVETFARQLGGALELRRTQEELAKAERRRQASAQELIDKGVDLLQICLECGRCYDQRAERCEEDDFKLLGPRPFPYRVAGRYRLTRVLGEGGMGTVFAARDGSLERDVACKVVKAEHFDDERVRVRFENEARVIARIDHPGVVSVFDFGEVEDGSLFIVMEALQGHNLCDLVKRAGPGTPAQVASLLRQGAAALGAAHKAGLVHRDIKPENIFLVPDGDGFRVKILDFGVAKEVGVDTRLTQTGMLVGTPLFMSPEQALGAATDYRSDIYSFGAVLFFALLGRLVSEEETFWMVLLDIVHNPAPPISQHLPSAPPALDEAFRSALAKSPDDRPGSVEQWAESFAEVLERTESDAAGWMAEGGLRAAAKPVKISEDCKAADLKAADLQATQLEKHLGPKDS